MKTLGYGRGLEIKLFYNVNELQLEQDVNEWLEREGANKDIIDIRYQYSSGDNYSAYGSLMILYIKQRKPINKPNPIPYDIETRNHIRDEIHELKRLAGLGKDTTKEIKDILTKEIKKTIEPHISSSLDSVESRRQLYESWKYDDLIDEVPKNNNVTEHDLYLDEDEVPGLLPQLQNKKDKNKNENN